MNRNIYKILMASMALMMVNCNKSEQSKNKSQRRNTKYNSYNSRYQPMRDTNSLQSNTLQSTQPSTLIRGTYFYCEECQTYHQYNNGVESENNPNVRSNQNQQNFSNYQERFNNTNNNECTCEVCLGTHQIEHQELSQYVSSTLPGYNITPQQSREYNTLTNSNNTNTNTNSNNKSNLESAYQNRSFNTTRSFKTNNINNSKTNHINNSKKETTVNLNIGQITITRSQSRSNNNRHPQTGMNDNTFVFLNDNELNINGLRQRSSNNNHQSGNRPPISTSRRNNLRNRGNSSNLLRQERDQNLTYIIPNDYSSIVIPVNKIKDEKTRTNLILNTVPGILNLLDQEEESSDPFTTQGTIEGSETNNNTTPERSPERQINSKFKQYKAEIPVLNFLKNSPKLRKRKSSSSTNSNNSNNTNNSSKSSYSDVVVNGQKNSKKSSVKLKVKNNKNTGKKNKTRRSNRRKNSKNSSKCSKTGRLKNKLKHHKKN